MANLDLLVLVGNRPTRTPSSDATVDFSQIRIGTTPIALQEIAGNLDIGGVKLVNVTAGGSAGEALTFDQVGANNGVASLDSGGKIPLAQLPASLMEYQGTWDASTNDPELADGTGVSGYFYRVQVAGTQDLGSGSQDFVVGDWVMYNGSIWQLAHAGADAVISVNTKSGVVVLNTDDISETGSPTNKWFTNARAIAAPITGYSSGAGTVAATDTILQAINKLNGNTALKLDTSAFTDAAVTSKLITGFSSGAGTVSGSDTILQAIQKLDGNTTAVSALVTATLSLTNDNGGSITVNQIVYIKANGHVDLARADTANLADFDVAIVKDATIATTASGNIYVKGGTIIGGFTSLTPGQKVYVSRGTAGALTQSLSGFVAGEFVYCVGRAVSATQINYQPSFEFQY